MAQLFANNAATTLASPAAATDTSLTLTSEAAFPSPSGSDFFLLTLASGNPETAWEIVKVTARSGNTVTVVRAQEGTTAQAWASGSKAELRLTAGGLSLLAPLASPALTGTPTAPTAPTGDNSATIATTALVQAKIAANAPGLAPVQSVAGRTGAVTLAVADVAGAQPVLGYTPVNKAGDSDIGNLSMGALSATTGTFSSTVTASQFNGSGAGLTSIPNSALTNSSVTIGTTNIALGSSSTTLNGLSRVTIDPLTGSANAYLYLIGRNAGVAGQALIHSNFTGGLNLVPASGQTTFIKSTLSVTGPGTFSGLLTANAGVSATTGTFSGPVSPGSYTVATLPSGAAGMMAYATNGRKVGEDVGAGTGVLAIYTNSAWRDPSQAYAVVVA